MVLAKREITSSPVDDKLYSGQVYTQPWEIKAGTYSRRDVLSLDEATKQLQLNADGTKAFAVMVHDKTLTVDTTLPVYVWGEQFNEDELNFNGQDVTDTKIALRKLGIFVRKFDEV